MRKSIVSASLVFALTVPVWLTAAYPDGGMTAQAATKKPTAKAKAVIQKIKAINSTKTTYLTKVQAAQKAYAKLSKKDKQLVSNVKTLQAHVKKIKPYEKKITAVQKQITALKSTKKTYVKDVKAAKKAYDRLPTVYRAGVANKAKLTKHVSTIAAYEKKAKTLQKQVSAITKTNYPKQVVVAQKTYASMNAVTLALVPTKTVATLQTYTTSATAKAQVQSVLSSLLTDDDDQELTIEDVTEAIDKTDVSALVSDLLSLLANYKKMDDFQKSLFDEDETALIEAFMQDEKQIHDTHALVVAYNKLDPKASTYTASTFDLAYKFSKLADEYTQPDNYFSERMYDVLGKMETKYADSLNLIDEFNKKAQELSDAPTLLAIEDATSAYAELTSTMPKKPADLKKYVDSALLKTYTAYSKVPAVITAIDGLPNYASVTATSPATAKQLTAIKNVQTLYKALGKEQKALVDTELATTPELNFAKEETQLKAGEKIQSTYVKAFEKGDINAMIASSGAYGKAEDDVKKYVTDGKAITDIQTTYKTQIQDAEKFIAMLQNLDNGKDKNGKTLANLDGLEGSKINGVVKPSTNSKERLLAVNNALDDLIKAYKQLVALKAKNPSAPAALDMLSKTDVKNYTLYTTLPALILEGNKVADQLQNKPYEASPELQIEGKDYNYNTADENRIIAFAKTYNTLTEPQKRLADAVIIITKRKNNEKTPIARVWGQEANNIKIAQKLDATILKLNSGSKSFAADVKKVYNQYKSAAPETKKYVINQQRLQWFYNLISGTSSSYPQGKANAFEQKVGALNSESTHANIGDVMSYYSTMIEHDTSTQSLIPKTVMKKYNEYVNAYNAVTLLKATPLGTTSKLTTKDVKNIQDAIKLYDKLTTQPKAAAMNGIGKGSAYAIALGQSSEIKEASTIDSAYQELKPSSKTYTTDLITLYTTYDNASDTVRKYVTSADALNAIATKYAKKKATALAFKAKVDALGSGGNLGNVHDLRDYYNANVDTDAIVKAFVPKATMALYKGYIVLLDIQAVARYKYFYNNWCSTDESIYYSYLYVDITPDKLIDTLTAYNNLNVNQQGIIALTPTTPAEQLGTVCYVPTATTERNVIRDPEFLTDATFVKEAAKIDQLYTALDPKATDYLQKVMEVVNAYERASSDVKPFVRNASNILDLKAKYSAAYNSLDAFIKAVDLLSVDSSVKGNNTASASTVSAVNDMYYKLRAEVQKAVPKATMTIYNKYLPLLKTQVPALRDAKQATDKLLDAPTVTTPYTEAQMEQLQTALAAYKKLDTLQKTIANKDKTLNTGSGVIGSNDDLQTYVRQEAYIVAANKLDDLYNKFVASYGTTPYFDPSTTKPPLVEKDAEKYSKALRTLINTYNQLSNNARYYVVNTPEILVQKDAFDNEYSRVGGVEEFEEAVAKLTSKSTILDVQDLVAQYTDFTPYEKAWIDSKVLSKYKDYAPIDDIVQNLDAYDISTTMNKTEQENTALQTAINLYAKLKADPKAIMTAYFATDEDAKNAMAASPDVKAADKVDQLIGKIVKGTNFFSQYVAAKRAYEQLTPEQLNYLKKAETLAKYDALVNKVQYTYAPLGSYLQEDGMSITGNPYEMLRYYEGVVAYLDDNADQVAKDRTNYIANVQDLINLRSALNKYVKINGTSTKPSVSALAKAIARYSYYYKAYDMKNQLKVIDAVIKTTN
ncbi:hypothetical protein [Kurthia senegalensis]|uniref:hypothetical protein n=1 Tax=Kurthia senegalensis TaxID=1033740 RepID=UPI000287EA4D|nr:hypothetical protein [Kurthia senegalensis]